MTNLRSLPLCAFASVLFAVTSVSTASVAQQPANQARPEVRIVNPIDESQLVTLKGNVHPAAIAKNDRGPVSASFALPDLTLVLSRSADEQAAFDAYVAAEYDPTSPNFHQWLTPAEIGERFGPAETDIATISGWLSSHGFTVNRISPDRMTIRFAGTAGQVQTAFHTQIHNLSVNGAWHYANMTDPQIPAALAPVVLGVKALHNFLPHPLHRLGSLVQFNQQAGKWQRITNSSVSSRQAPSPALSATLSAGSKQSSAPRPMFGINGSPGTDDAYLEEDVAPYDFATMYNVLPLWNKSINGSGQTIAIAGTSFINVGKSGGANDVAAFRSAFGLSAGLTPNEIDAGSYFNTGTTASICTSSTAFCNTGDLTENSLDVEWSGAIAPGAQIDLVVTGQSSACNDNTGAGCIDTVYDSAAYVVENVTAKILSLSYGECELGNGTSGNVAYYDLWQSAAAEGIAVFVASGDSGSPSCDDDEDSNYGNPYTAQYGLSVSGMASTPYDTAVGGTDFSWCQPYFNASGDFEGCATSSTTQGSPSYWTTSNNSTTGESALNYVPEIPWNDTCENPILGRYVSTLLSASGFSSYFGINPTTPEETCSALVADFDGDPGWYQFYEGTDGEMLANFVDTVGGGGGASNCVSNNADIDPDNPSCNTGATTVANGSSSIALTNDGWPVPPWQSGVPGTSGLTTRSIPDVSFFAGNGALYSATLICDTNDDASCTTISATGTDATGGAEELGGTSVGTPEMAGVMALINQDAGGSQGLPNAQLYKLAASQTYSECSAETVKNSSNCYFQDIDNGPTASSGPAYTTAQTISMPCNLDNSGEGGAFEESNGEWDIINDGLPAYAGTTSPNCAAINSGDVAGTLVSSGTTAAYNSGTGFDLATGLGSLNVANVANAWVSDAGTAAATVSATATPSTITINQALTVKVTVSGSGATPTGTVALSSGTGYTANQSLSGGVATFDIPANSLTAGSLTLTANYSGDLNYASAIGTVPVTVNVMTPTVAVSALSPANAANPLNVTVTVAGPTGATAVPSGSVYLKYGTTTTAGVTLLGGSASFTIAANTLMAGSLTITADYSGDSNYAGGTGADSVTITQTTALTPTIAVAPASGSIDTSQSLGVAVTVSGAGATPTGNVTLKGGSYTSSATALSSGIANFTIPANSLTAGTVTLTANYSGDSNYAAGSNTASVTVTQSAYALTATTPTAVSPGSSTTSTISGTASTTDYTGTVTLNSCSLTSSSVSSPTSPPTCTVSGTITYASGTATGSGTATITTTSNSAMLDTIPGTRPGGKGWLGAGGGAVLAFLVFLGVPARRRSWRALLGMVMLLASLGSLTACGGGSINSSGGESTATSAGTYTFTVTGKGNDSASTQGTGTFIVTVN